MVNAKEVEAYLEYLSCFEPNLGLSIITELCRRLGDLQKSLRYVHIAGTNGKGSVLCFITSIMQAAGYKTGRFFSPALREYREKIGINRQMISKADFAHHLTNVKAVCEAMVADGFSHPSSFEVDVAIAFSYFAQKKVDLVVLETGMGGKDDATNIIPPPLVAVITPISLDHAKWLGNTIEQITAHKLGIIKDGASVIRWDDNLPCHLTRSNSPKIDTKNKSFTQYFSYGNWQDLRITLAGDYQVDNAVLAIRAATALAQKGYTIPEKAIRQGLAQAKWPGRFELIGTKPYFIIDGAHNPEGAKKLAETLSFYFPKHTKERRIVFIIGVMSDKDYEQMIANIYHLASDIITVTPPFDMVGVSKRKRALNALDLANIAVRYHPRVTTADSVAEACELGRLLAGREGVVVAFGSFSLYGGGVP